MKVTKFAAYLCLATALIVPSVAHAEDPALVEAQARFGEGLELADKGKHEEARLKFKQAATAFGTPSVLYNLARSEQLTGHHFDALLHYKAFLRVGEIDPKISDAMRERARTYIAELNKKAGQIDLTAPPQARISVDGQVVELVSFELLAVPPGPHVVEATFDGRVKSITVDCRAGFVTKAVLDFEKKEKDADAVSPPMPPVRGDPTRGWVASGFAAAGVLGMGLGFGFARASHTAKYTENALRKPGVCFDPTAAACSDLKDARDKVDAYGTASTVGYVAGSVLIAGGIASFVFWPKKAAGGFGMAPLPGGGSLSLDGSF